MKYLYCLARPAKCNEHVLAYAISPGRFPPAKPGDSSELRSPYITFGVFTSGLEGAEVYCISFERISALISDVKMRGTAPCDSVENAMAHQEVVDAAMQFSMSIIPCRFGTLFPDDDSILAFLKEHYDLLDSELTRLEGRIEVSVQMILDRPEVLKPIPIAAHLGTQGQGDAETCEHENIGIGYLLKKKEQFDTTKKLEEEADRFSEKLNQATSPFWSDVKAQRRAAGKTLLLSMYYLVDQRKLPSFRLTYLKFKRENPALRLLYTGPWAPYNFADINLSE